VDPSNIGRNFSGKFPEKSWKLPDISRNFPKKNKKAAEIWRKNCRIFFSGLKNLFRNQFVKVLTLSR
jgi:hypothetical protein